MTGARPECFFIFLTKETSAKYQYVFLPAHFRPISSLQNGAELVGIQTVFLRIRHHF